MRTNSAGIKLKLYNQVLRIIKIAVKSDVKTGRIERLHLHDDIIVRHVVEHTRDAAMAHQLWKPI